MVADILRTLKEHKTGSEYAFFNQVLSTFDITFFYLMSNFTNNTKLNDLPCSYSNDVSYPLPSQLRRLIDVKVTSTRRHSAKVLSTPICNSIVSMVIDLWCHLIYNLREAWHTMCTMLLSNYK